jgi:hypothetical protein
MAGSNGSDRNTKILVTAAIGLGLGLIVAAIVIAVSGGDDGPPPTAAATTTGAFESPPPTADPPASGDHLVSGRPIVGELTLGVPLRTFTFNGERGDSVTIHLMAHESDLDSRLLLVGPDDTEVASDDDGGEGLNSFLDVQLPETGAYRLHAYCYALTNCGAYELLFTHTPAR